MALVDQTVVSGTNFLTAILLARLCSKEEYGLYVLAFSLLLFWDSLRNSLIASALVVFLPKKPLEQQASYAGSTTVMEAILILGGAVLFGAGALVLRAIGEHRLALVVFACIFAVAGYTGREHVRRLYFAKLKIVRAVWIDGASGALQLGSLLLLNHAGYLSSVSLLLVLGASKLLAAVGGLLLLRDQVSFSHLELREDMRAHWGLGRWLIGGFVVYMGAYQLYPWLINFSWGESLTAVYGACGIVMFICNPVIFGIRNILSVKMAYAHASGGRPALEKLLRRWNGIMIVVIGAIVIPITLFAEPLLQLFYGGRYAGFGAIVGLNGVNLFLSAIAVPLLCALITIERTEMIFWAGIGSLVLTLTAGVAMVYAWGLLGALAGVIACRSLTVVMYWLSYRRHAGGAVSQPAEDITE